MKQNSQQLESLPAYGNKYWGVLNASGNKHLVRSGLNRWIETQLSGIHLHIAMNDPNEQFERFRILGDVEGVADGGPSPIKDVASHDVSAYRKGVHVAASALCPEDFAHIAS